MQTMYDPGDIEGIYPIYESLLPQLEDLKAGDAFMLEPTDFKRRISTLDPSKLSLSEKLTLIKRFLLSMSFKDCSIMISLADGDFQAKLPHKTARTKRKLNDDLRFKYKVTLLDVDPKPVDKMKHYFELDRQIAENFRQKQFEKTCRA